MKLVEKEKSQFKILRVFNSGKTPEKVLQQIIIMKNNKPTEGVAERK